MSLITAYRFADCTCGRTDMRSWPYPPKEASCGSCGRPLHVVVGVEHYVAYVPFSAIKRFQPHFNSSLGIHIESPEHFDAMKRQAGAMDAELSPGASCDSGVPSSVPRDWFAQTEKAAKTMERIQNDAGIAAESAADDAEFASDPITTVDIPARASAA